MNFRNPLQLIGVLLSVAVWFDCGNTNVAGNASEVDNVQGRLVKADGAPASGTQVYLRPSEYLPSVSAKIAAQQTSGQLGFAVTDSFGMFSFDNIPAGSYVLECIDPETETGALIESVVLNGQDSTAELLVDTLKALGGISGQIAVPVSTNLTQVRIMVYGLDRITTPDLSGAFTIPDLPQGKYDLHLAGSGLSVDLRGDRGTTVTAGQTTTVPVSALSFNENGLVGYWPFDENEGQNAFDASGNGNTGFLGNEPAADANDPVWVAGKIGSCLQFDSLNDTRVIIDAATSSMDSLSAFTYTIWINPSEYGSRYSRILSREITPYRFDDFFICVDGYKGIGVGISDINDSAHGGNSDSNLVSLNTWQHIAVTYNDAGDRTVHIFINGVEVQYFQPPDTLSAPLRLTSNPLTIGNIFQIEERPFIGKIDEVKVYNRVLSQAEIQAEMNRQ